MTAQLDHPTLGKIRGTSANGITKYLGIKYATLKHRFALPELTERESFSDEIDATNFGPCIPQPPSGLDFEFGLIQQSLDRIPYNASETDGLNLNIFSPADAKPGQDLPVLVWIHGGGFFTGANSWLQWDMARLLQMAHDKGSPMLAISINYRLGASGFLTSEELQEAGIRTNRGLRDQAAALEWIKEHIAGFGGDPDNVTAIGQSMGAASVAYQLHSPKPLFKRMIAMGGNSLALQPLPPFVPDSIYPVVLGALGLQDLSETDRVEQLKTMPIDDFLQKIPSGLPMVAVADGEIIPEILTFEKLPKIFPDNHWCKEIFVGDCALDASIIGDLVLEQRRKGIGKAFAESIKKSFENKPQAVETILQTYDIDETLDMDDKDFVSICKFGTDVAYDAPSTAFAKTWSDRGGAYRYYFNEPNTWPGKWQGHSAHVLDAAYLMQNFNDKLNGEQQATAKKMASDVISFVNGKGIEWEFQKNGVHSLVYGPTEEPDTDTDEKSGRRISMARMVEEGVATPDELLNAWSAFFQGK